MWGVVRTSKLRQWCLIIQVRRATSYFSLISSIHWLPMRNRIYDEPSRPPGTSTSSIHRVARHSSIWISQIWTMSDHWSATQCFSPLSGSPCLSIPQSHIAITLLPVCILLTCLQPASWALAAFYKLIIVRTIAVLFDRSNKLLNLLYTI